VSDNLFMIKMEMQYQVRGNSFFKKDKNTRHYHRHSLKS
jgi:hypothetical protein